MDPRAPVDPRAPLRLDPVDGGDPFGPRVLGLFGLLRSRLLIATCGAVGALAGVTAGALELDTYVARAKLRYLPGTRQQLTDEAAVGLAIEVSLRRSETAMEEEVELLQDPLVYERTAEAVGVPFVLGAADPAERDGPGTGLAQRWLHRFQSWTLGWRGLAEPCPGGVTPAHRAAAVDLLQARTLVAPSGDTEIIDVVVRDTSPERAVRLAEELVGQMLRRHLEIYEVESDLELLRESKASAYERLTRARAAFLEYKQQCGFFDMENDLVANQELNAGSEAQLALLEQDRERLLGVVGALELELGLRGDAVDASGPSGPVNPRWLALQVDIAEVDEQLRQIDAVPTPGAFTLRRRARLVEEREQLVRTLEGTERRGAGSGLAVLEEGANQALLNAQSMLSRAKGDLEGVASQIGVARRQLAELRDQRRAMEACAVEHVRLGREVRSAETQYTALTANERELAGLAIMDEEALSNLVVFRPPVRPRFKEGPNRKKPLLVGIASGLALGLGLAVLRQLVDARVRHRETVEGQLGLPLLCAVPEVPRRTRSRRAHGVA